jgi:hypothetical protein
MFPDTLNFRHFPREWGWVEGLPPWYEPLIDGVGFPEYVLRFNGAKDIIVFHASRYDQDNAVKIAKLSGSLPTCFSKIRYVGIAVDKFCKSSQSTIPALYGASMCAYNTEECQDYCKEEPLQRLLSLFPLLEKFYIASVPSSSTHQPGDQILTKSPSRDANCHVQRVRGILGQWLRAVMLVAGLLSTTSGLHVLSLG